MVPSLSLIDLAHLEAASRALLSPLAAPDLDTWRSEVMRALCDLFGAETGTFALPGQRRFMVGHGIDEADVDRIVNFTSPGWRGTGPTLEPLLDEFHRLLVQHRVEAWDMHRADHLLGGQGLAWRNLFYDEVLRPLQAGDTHSLFVPMPHGSAHLTVHTFHREVPAGHNLPLLQVLLPAFKAGLDAIERLAAHRAALDTVSEPLVAYDADGREVHRNVALIGLLNEEAEREQLGCALLELVHRLRLLAFPRRGETAPPPTGTLDVRTARGLYRLRGTLLAPGTFGADGAMLITVTAPAKPALPSAEEIRTRHGLTRREAEVALLVAEGLSNEEISARLFVSLHTVRHHVEATMAKLELQGRRRASVALRLLHLA